MIASLINRDTNLEGTQMKMSYEKIVALVSSHKPCEQGLAFMLSHTSLENALDTVPIKYIGWLMGIDHDLYRFTEDFYWVERTAFKIKKDAIVDRYSNVNYHELTYEKTIRDWFKAVVLLVLENKKE